MARSSYNFEAVYICVKCRKVTRGYVFADEKDSSHRFCLHCGHIESDDKEFWLDTWPPDTSPDVFGYSGGNAWRGLIRTS